MRYNKYILFACALTMFACSDDANNGSVSNPPQDEPPGKECQNQCQADEKKCDGNTSVVCFDTDNDGCVEWVSKECNDDEICTGGACLSQGEPLPSCTNECDNENVQVCADQDGQSGYKKCANFDDDTCLEWSSFIPCQDGSFCADGACGGCSNECSADGITECSNDGLRTCIDTNGDGCFEWSEVTPCEHGCDGDHCACAHECEENQKECNGEGYRTCTTDAKGCRVWSQVTACEYGCAEGDCKEAPKNEPTRYPGDQILSPVTTYVVESMKSIAAMGTSQNDNVFMKVGDSHMAPGSVFMYCFSKTKSAPNLNGDTFLQSVIDEFQVSTDSYNRDSEATVVGKTAYWANGEYLTKEMNAIKPRFAFYGYGTNDMGMYGYTHKEYFHTLEWFYQNVKKGMNTMMSNGVIPMLIGTGIRTDRSSLGGLQPIYFVPVFDAVARGLAEQYQVPYMNLQLAQQPLKSNNYGLNTSDNLHHTNKNGGCDFSDDVMLKYGANVRNRYAIEMLDRAWKSMYKGVEATDTVIPYIGSGSQAEPYIIDSLPYTHASDTHKGTNVISKYKCGNPDESGPEIYYKLVLTKQTKIRAFAISSSTSVDVDIHLQKEINSNECMTRGDRFVEANLEAGTYYFSVDTCNGDSHAGEYLFGILECGSDDPLCGSSMTGG